jgi:hypothetical protein
LIQAADMADEPDLIIAMIEAARRPENRTPAIILHPGPHWQRSESPVRYPQTPPSDRCAVCQQADGPQHPRDHQWMRPVSTETPTGTAAERRRQLIEEAKRELEVGKAKLCRHGAVVCALCDEGKPDPLPMPALDPTELVGEAPVAP